MTEHVRVEITRRVVPADEATLAHRAEVVQRMRNLGLLDADADGSVGELMDDGWTAQINGAVFPVVTYSVEPGGEGSAGVLVSMLVLADAVSVVGHAAPPSATPPHVRPAVPEQKPAVSTWGSAGRPDPRESIPGWMPATPASTDAIMTALRRQIAIAYHGDVQAALGGGSPTHRSTGEQVAERLRRLGLLPDKGNDDGLAGSVVPA